MPRERRSKYANDAVDNAQLASSLAQIQTLTVGVGTKAQRPDNPAVATLFFLTDKKRRIEFNGSNWQYFDGTPVDIFEITDANIYATSANYNTQTLAGNAETTYQSGINMTKDFILYSKVKLSDADDYFNINFNITGTNHFQVTFGYDWVGSTKDGSSISVHDSINAANIKLGSVNLYSAAHDVVLWYDHKWGYINVYVDNVLIGSWKPTSGGANIAGVNTVYFKAGSTSTLVTLDYLYMATPLVTAIGDSITAGANFHAPNPDHYAGLDNYSNNYPKMISEHLKTKGIKNYFVVNTGVNGETSDQMKVRFTTDIVNKGCKYVMIHGGINDHSTHHDINITAQNKIDMANSALTNNITPMILGVIPTKTGAPLESHQFSKDLHNKEKASYGAFTYVDLWTAIQGSTTDVADDTKMADTVHPNLAGYTAMTEEIKKFIVI
jgi:lysophospholipase L1-like esterase